MYDTTDFKKAIRIMLAESDIKSIAAIANQIDIKETTLRAAINNGAIRLNDFLKITNLLGYQVTISKNENRL